MTMPRFFKPAQARCVRPNSATTERLERTERALLRAMTLDPSLNYHADGKYVAYFADGKTTHVIECESHWDACLVLLSIGKSVMIDFDEWPDFAAAVESEIGKTNNG